jgi:hypothetical protein
MPFVRHAGAGWTTAYVPGNLPVSCTVTGPDVWSPSLCAVNVIAGEAVPWMYPPKSMGLAWGAVSARRRGRRRPRT